MMPARDQSRPAWDRPVTQPAPAEPSQPALDSQQILSELVALSDDLVRFEIGVIEDDATASLETARALEHTLGRALAHLQALERLHRGPDAELSFEFDEEPRTDVLAPGRMASSLADICFAAIWELSRAAAELSRTRSPDDALSAVETALRKLRRAVHAVLDAARSVSLPELADGWRSERQIADLECALVVRRLYTEFRRSLRRPQVGAPDAALTALRYAAGALATLIASNGYQHARVSDRVLLRRMQARLLSWARQGQGADEGLQLLEDVCTCADLLRGVNRRQELRLHDLTVLQELQSHPSEDISEWLSGLSRLFGLDDALDALVEQARRGPTAELIAQLRVRLEQCAS